MYKVTSSFKVLYNAFDLGICMLCKQTENNNTKPGGSNSETKLMRKKSAKPSRVRFEATSLPWFFVLFNSSNRREVPKNHGPKFWMSKRLRRSTKSKRMTTKSWQTTHLQGSYPFSSIFHLRIFFTPFSIVNFLQNKKKIPRNFVPVQALESWGDLLRPGENVFSKKRMGNLGPRLGKMLWY